LLSASSDDLLPDNFRTHQMFLMFKTVKTVAPKNKKIKLLKIKNSIFSFN